MRWGFGTRRGGGGRIVPRGGVTGDPVVIAPRPLEGAAPATTAARTPWRVQRKGLFLPLHVKLLGVAQ